MQALQIAPISLEDYLSIEQQENNRYEFHDGYIYAMAGGTISHGRISTNLIRGIGAQLDKNGSHCEPFNSDIKLHIESGNRFVYPDMMVVCGKEQISSKYKEAITNPTLIVEVLSESTEGYDRGDKFYFYQKIESLKQYVLVNQQKAQVELWTRGEGDFWKMDRVTGLGNSVTLDSIDVELALADVYRNVEFENESKV
jgi:Uma2 family endonuclease